MPCMYMLDAMLTCAVEEPPKRASRSRRLRSADAAGAPPVVFDLPMTRDEAVQGAVQGIRRAWAAGDACIDCTGIPPHLCFPVARHEKVADRILMTCMTDIQSAVQGITTPRGM